MCSIKILNGETLKPLFEAAMNSVRKRAAKSFHQRAEDPVQRIVIVAHPDTYVAPHRHPGKKWEMMVLIDGELDLLFFDEVGVLESRLALSAAGNRLAEYDASKFHAAVVKAENTTVLEVKEGPYDPATAKELPDWAPEEGDPTAAAFNARLREMTEGDCVLIR